MHIEKLAGSEQTLISHSTHKTKFMGEKYLHIYLGGATVEPSPLQLCALLTLFIFGNWLHHSSDVQVQLIIPKKTGLFYYIWFRFEKKVVYSTLKTYSNHKI